MPFKTRLIESIWVGETNRRLHCDGCRRGQCGGNSGPSSRRSGDGAAWQPGGQCRAGQRRESQTAGRCGLLPARPGTQPRRPVWARFHNGERDTCCEENQKRESLCSCPQDEAICKEVISAGQNQPELGADGWRFSAFPGLVARLNPIYGVEASSARRIPQVQAF
jgi:hypothetical protein